MATALDALLLSWWPDPWVVDPLGLTA